MTSAKRLIEAAFPLKRASLDSVHEKNVRRGHISTLHIWPARRPLAACRAALIATLLADPGTAEKRNELFDRLAGRLEAKKTRKKLPSGKVEEIAGFETMGGILHWGRESRPDLDWFRAEIRKAYGGKAPRVLDPFAGGGAIPLEAMRLGCDVSAVDINPVAWFILKCTLEYPQKLCREKRRMPDLALVDRELMEAFFKAQGLKGALLRTRLERLGLAEDREPQLTGIEAGDSLLEGSLAWHVRAWGRWILNRARKELSEFYPTYAEFEPLGKHLLDWRQKKKERNQELVPFDQQGRSNVAALNSEFDEQYLSDERNPRWVAKPTVAYLWARTVACKNCRATIPLLKTRWLCRKDAKRTLLTIAPRLDKSGVILQVQEDVPIVGANPAARRENDRRIGAGTMNKSGAQCPSCNASIMTMEDIGLESRAGRVGEVMTAVIVEGQDGKEYRSPTSLEEQGARKAASAVEHALSRIPFGELTEPISPQRPSPNTRGASGLPRYGIDTWGKLFSTRQRLDLATFVFWIRELPKALRSAGYDDQWTEAIAAYATAALSRLADRENVICTWQSNAEQVNHAFARYVLPISWDYAEMNPIGDTSGGYGQAIGWVAEVLDHLLEACVVAGEPEVIVDSAVARSFEGFDAVVTDPPYYDAIPYSDVMDFFHVWLRRALWDLGPEFNAAFKDPLGPKWKTEESDGELVDQPGRFGNDTEVSKRAYEDGMAKVFARCHAALKPEGRMVIVFANKNPSAWETLVSALIRAGFTVDASWPIQTERAARTNALTTASLASSVWLVCRKRLETASRGWDGRVLEEMHANITLKLREFWDAGINGPDFVWAATGPALEAYSKYPVVRKANNPNEPMGVKEFLEHVRRIVVNFVVGRVLFGESTSVDTSELDDVTTYYLLHRHDFGMEDAPVGACILYALSCNLLDKDLADQYDVLLRTGGKDEPEDSDEADEVEDDTESSAGSGSKVKLKAWQQRKGRSLGYESVGGRPAPLIDQVHRLMHLWKLGEVVKVNEYLDARALRQNKMFHHLLQALIELSPHASEERSLLESISNHVVARGVAPQEELKL